jgi:MFS family permease
MATTMLAARAARRPTPGVTALAGLVTLGVAMGIGRFAFTPILPMMQQDAAVSVAVGGWLASANYLGYLLGAISAVTLRARATTIVRAGLLVIGLVTMGMGMTGSFLAWLLLRALAGVASAWVLVFASAWALGRLGAAERPVLRGAVFGGVGAGIAAAGLLCVALMERGAGSASAWRALGAIALAATAAVWPALREDRAAGGAPDPRRAAGRPRWDLDSVRLVLCHGILGLGYIIPATFVPAMARTLVPDPLVFGWAWPIFGAAAMASTLVAGAAIRVVANRRLWALSQLVMAAGVAAPVLWPSMGGIMVAALLVGGTFMVSTMGGMQEAQIVAGPHATRLMAAMTAAFAAGQIAGPLLVATAVGPNRDFSWPLSIACLLLLVSAGALARRVEPGQVSGR